MIEYKSVKSSKKCIYLPSFFAGFCLALISSLRSFPFFFLLFCVLLLHQTMLLLVALLHVSRLIQNSFYITH